jgi:hypothetical protein
MFSNMLKPSGCVQDAASNFAVVILTVCKITYFYGKKQRFSVKIEFL